METLIGFLLQRMRIQCRNRLRKAAITFEFFSEKEYLCGLYGQDTQNWIRLRIMLDLKPLQDPPRIGLE